ncbi:MAG: carboxypeptidase-like regulatory domain-containing protein [Terriglobales bacterium]
MPRIFLLWTALAVCVAAQAGQNVAGSVLDLTTGTPLANASVTLIQLQDNMNQVGQSTTDAQGHYRFSENSPGPFMVQVNYQGVPYFAKVSKGQSETNVSVYGVSHESKLLRVDAEIMVLQPDQGQLAIVNEYRVENGLQPMRTLAAKGGMFQFRVPPGAHVDMVRVVAPNEMPLARSALPTANHNVYRVDSPLRPGETRIQISYRVPYAGLQAAITETPVFVPAHFEVYVPQAMTFTGAGFSQVGEQQGYNVYGIASGPVAATLTFNVAGDAPLPPEVAQAAPGDATAGASAGGSASASPEAATPPPATAVGTVPTSTLLERNQWTVFILLALAAAAGFGVLLARSERAPSAAAPALSLAPAALPPAATVPALPAAPGDDLASLKDDFFLLEVRRHTGSISELEYAQARAALSARMDRLARR